MSDEEKKYVYSKICAYVGRDDSPIGKREQVRTIHARHVSLKVRLNVCVYCKADFQIL